MAPSHPAHWRARRRCGAEIRPVFLSGVIPAPLIAHGAFHALEETPFLRLDGEFQEGPGNACRAMREAGQILLVGAFGGNCLPRPTIASPVGAFQKHLTMA